MDSGETDAETQRFIQPQRERADLVVIARPANGRSARAELRITHPLALPALDELRKVGGATVLHVSSAAAGPDVIAIDGDGDTVRWMTLRLLAEYLAQRALPRPTLSPAAARPAHPVPGA